MEAGIFGILFVNIPVLTQPKPLSAVETNSQYCSDLYYLWMQKSPCRNSFWNLFFKLENSPKLDAWWVRRNVYQHQRHLKRHRLLGKTSTMPFSVLFWTLAAKCPCQSFFFTFLSSLCLFYQYQRNVPQQQLVFNRCLGGGALSAFPKEGSYSVRLIKIYRAVFCLFTTYRDLDFFLYNFIHEFT